MGYDEEILPGTSLRNGLHYQAVYRDRNHQVYLRNWSLDSLVKKVIVTTTINPPTEAILRFDAMTDWDLVVIGDKKTPDYSCRER